VWHWREDHHALHWRCYRKRRNVGVTEKRRNHINAEMADGVIVKESISAIEEQATL